MIMPRRKPSGQVVVVPKAQVIEPTGGGEEREAKNEGLWMGPMDALTNEVWSVRPPDYHEPAEKADEFPLPPVWTVEWKDEWDDLLYPPYPDEVTEGDATRNSFLGASTTA
jgi:hypothetical protein